MHDELRGFILLTCTATPLRDRLLAELEARKAKGLETYNSLLQPFNGRDAVQDAFEEALDLAAYLQQVYYEESSGQLDLALLDDLRYHLFSTVRTCNFLARHLGYRESGAEETAEGSP
jgi:hypothetical protein